MLRFILLIASALVVALPPMNASAHHNSVTTKYYALGQIDISVTDIQRVWKAKLKATAYDATTIEYLGYFNLLTPVYVDTGIQVSTWSINLEPLYVAFGGDMVPLNVVSLEAGKGAKSEGDTIEPISSGDYSIEGVRDANVWFALDSDGTLLIASDGVEVLGLVYGLH